MYTPDNHQVPHTGCIGLQDYVTFDPFLLPSAGLLDFEQPQRFLNSNQRSKGTDGFLLLIGCSSAGTPSTTERLVQGVRNPLCSTPFLFKVLSLSSLSDGRSRNQLQLLHRQRVTFHVVLQLMLTP